MGVRIRKATCTLPMISQVRSMLLRCVEQYDTSTMRLTAAVVASVLRTCACTVQEDVLADGGFRLFFVEAPRRAPISACTSSSFPSQPWYGDSLSTCHHRGHRYATAGGCAGVGPTMVVVRVAGAIACEFRVDFRVPLLPGINQTPATRKPGNAKS